MDVTYDICLNFYQAVKVVPQNLEAFAESSLKDRGPTANSIDRVFVAKFIQAARIDIVCMGSITDSFEDLWSLARIWKQQDEAAEAEVKASILTVLPDGSLVALP